MHHLSRREGWPGKHRQQRHTRGSRLGFPAPGKNAVCRVITGPALRPISSQPGNARGVTGGHTGDLPLDFP